MEAIIELVHFFDVNLIITNENSFKKDGRNQVSNEAQTIEDDEVRFSF